MNVYYFYEIYSLNNDYVYIGSTKNVVKRLQQHKSNCNNPQSRKYNLKIYETIRANGGFDNFIFNVMETIETNNIEHVKQRETQLMIHCKANLNTRRAFTTDDEKRRQKFFYRIENRNKINERQNEKFNCECGGTYTRYLKSRHLKTNKHKQHEEKQVIYNITNNYNITNLTIQN